MTDDRLGAIDPRASIERVLDRAIGAGAALRGADDARVIAAIASAARTLADPATTLGREARERVPTRSGLSSPNVERALATTLAALDARSLEGALAALRAGPAIAAPLRLAGLVLAGNVFTAAIRPIAWALLGRTPVAIKPSTGDEGLAELFAVAIAEADPELGESLAMLRFARSDAAMLSALAARCDAVHAWGSDRTITELRAAMPASTSLVPHGHGLGIAHVSGGDPEASARAIAEDVALYDQRGCLSPHAVLVEGDSLALARAIERALADVERAMPRGPLSPAAGAAQMQWRGVAAARGELLEGSTWAVSYEAAHPLRISPGHRNVGVYDVRDRADLCARLAPLGAHLKSLGTDGDRDALARALPPPLAPRICALGEMQAPPLLASADGEPPWTGFVRRLDVE